MTDTKMQELKASYAIAEYHVLGPHPFVMRVGKYCPELSELHDRTGSKCSMFITAYNPLSVPQTTEVNEAAHTELLRDLAMDSIVEGVGKAPDGNWPEEKSVLVLKMEYPDSGYDLCRKYRQHAFLWCPESAVPMLLMVDDHEMENYLTLNTVRRSKGMSRRPTVPFFALVPVALGVTAFVATAARLAGAK